MKAITLIDIILILLCGKMFYDIKTSYDIQNKKIDIMHENIIHSGKCITWENGFRVNAEQVKKTHTWKILNNGERK